MRVSTTQIHNQGLQSILDQQTKLIKTQNQLSSGEKFLAPSDNPSAASRVLDLDEAIARIIQHEENADFATQRLGVEESSLASIENILQRSRELALQAGNTATQTSVTRQAIAGELKENLDQLFDIANSKDANGEYLFAGFQSSSQPFTTDGLGNFTYNGDQGQIALQIGSTRQVVANDSGAEVFQLIRNGNGSFSVDANSTNTGNGIISTGSVQNPALYQAQDFTITFTSATTYDVFNVTTGVPVPPAARPYTEGGAINFNGIEVDISGTPATGDVFTVNASRNQDMFTTLYDLIDTIENSPDDLAGNAQFAQGIANALNDIDRAMDNVIDVRTSVGGRMNSIDSQADDNAARKLQYQSIRSQIKDLDFAEAISKMTFESTALQVAQQTFARVQNLSLFNVI